MLEKSPTCPRCGGRLMLHRTWRRVYLRCRVCGADHPLERFAHNIDQMIEDLLAAVPCDRL